eukprot:TRINITY_DN2357_c0_g1_i3.p1 TRINITY_DN2357_c0_g1~~TRINITY_DN2357_c0_g1_i3.p1  ORF type:complete len:203 (+),score=34.22 TRINITY_DN2357_c0_g1_i3:435-1043(+)
MIEEEDCSYEEQEQPHKRMLVDESFENSQSSQTQNSDDADESGSSMDVSSQQLLATDSPLLDEEEEFNTTPSSISARDFEGITDLTIADEEEEQTNIEQDLNVFATLTRTEKEMYLQGLINPEYFQEVQRNVVTPNRRKIVIKWLAEVANEPTMSLSSETQFLAANLLDRFLSRKPIHINHLQLLGITCAFIGKPSPLVGFY